MTETNKNVKLGQFRERLHEVIYEADTPMGRLFDIALFFCIITSVILVMLESVESIAVKYGTLFQTLEWIFTAIFTLEYILRLYCIDKPWKYVTSFYGIIDLLAILPGYLGLFIGSKSNYFMMIRAMRLLRIFRILKLTHYNHQGNIILKSLRKSKQKIFVFLFFVLIVVMIVGSLMYVIEGSVNESYSNIPNSIYWAIVTLTTVGYGDITPITPLGRFLASTLMILGYVVIAVPTGIVSAELLNTSKSTNTQACRSCSRGGHEDDALYCKHCGVKLNL